MPEEAAEKKLVTWVFLSLGEPARKMFKDKYPEVSVWTLRAQKMIDAKLLPCCPQQKVGQAQYFIRKTTTGLLLVAILAFAKWPGL